MAKILVIDDENTLRQTILTILRYAGYEVLDAADGFAGIKLARDHMPDLIVSDIVMPGLDGYGVLSRLRDDPQTATIPVILVTALAERQAMREGMALGADDYLVKPFAPGELLDTVRTRLQRQASLAEKHDSTLRDLRKNIVYALPHEMRTPLHLILGFAQLLEMHPDSATPEEILQATGAIIKAGRRLERLIENYLVYAQLELIASDPLEMEGLRQHFTPDPAAVIETAAWQQAEVHNRTTDLTIELHSAALHIAETDLAKIVLELVDNAFKFSDSDAPVRLVSMTRGAYYVLNICDNGRGMSAEQVQTIGAYMQFNRTFNEQQGLGLGLAVARRLAELHGGYINIDSRLDEGTNIYVHLPL